VKISNLLRSLDSALSPTAIVGRINDNFDAVKKLLVNKISLRDNVYCDVVTATFDSGSPRACKLTNLFFAKGAIVLGSSVPCMAGPVVGMEGKNAMVTLFFAGMAKSVTATVVIFDEGSGPTKQQTILGSVGYAGILKPDGVTTFASADGTLSVAASGPSGPWTLSTKPLVPDVDDDEFDVDSIASGAWTASGAKVLVNPILSNSYAPPAGTLAYNINAQRPGSLILQAPADGASYFIRKPITGLVAGHFVYTRVGFSGGFNGGQASLCPVFAFSLNDGVHYTFFYVNNTTGAVSLYNSNGGSAVNPIAGGQGGANVVPFLITYLGLYMVTNQIVSLYGAGSDNYFARFATLDMGASFSGPIQIYLQVTYGAGIMVPTCIEFFRRRRDGALP
jgi:hypothetical protein